MARYLGRTLILGTHSFFSFLACSANNKASSLISVSTVFLPPTFKTETCQGPLVPTLLKQQLTRLSLQAQTRSDPRNARDWHRGRRNLHRLVRRPDSHDNRPSRKRGALCRSKLLPRTRNQKLMGSFAYYCFGVVGIMSYSKYRVFRVMLLALYYWNSEY